MYYLKSTKARRKNSFFIQGKILIQGLTVNMDWNFGNNDLNVKSSSLKKFLTTSFKRVNDLLFFISRPWFAW